MKRYAFLGIAILIATAILAGAGIYLKYDILKPMDLYQDKSIFELPFLMHSDDFLRFMVEHADEMMQQPTDFPIPTDPTQPSVPGPTDPSTPENTVPDSSDPSMDHTGPTDPFGPTDPTETAPKPTEPRPTEPNPTRPKDEPNFDFPGASVDDSWFDNTLFIGDSRVVGLREFARSGNADYFCDVGMTVFNYKDKKLSDKNFGTQSLDSLLASKKYDRIIINFGLNECGYPAASFNWAFNDFLNKVRDAQPDAKIILQGIMSVTRKKANSASYFAISNLQRRSNYIKSLADGVNVFYIDCNEYFADADGYMFTSLTNDGCHPTGTGYGHWRDWIAYAVATLGI